MSPRCLSASCSAQTWRRGWRWLNEERLKRLLVRREQLTRAARARALAATEAKTEFLATMSHEIRTPLNSVLGFAQLLAARNDLPPDARRQVNLIDSAGGALLTVVNDILDFSRVEAGQVELAPQPTAAAALLRDTVAIMAPEARAKGLTLDVEIVDPVDALHDLDDTRLRQVLLNLLNNAVKFTDEGEIVIRVREAARGARWQFCCALKPTTWESA